ncbi:hypothetical protein ED5_1361 [Enterobacter roggenkampii]|nr:hypothetical protein ED5_1361 [Enterobacter roggenkampii]
MTGGCTLYITVTSFYIQKSSEVSSTIMIFIEKAAKQANG